MYGDLLLLLSERTLVLVTVAEGTCRHGIPSPGATHSMGGDAMPLPQYEAWMGI